VHFLGVVAGHDALIAAGYVSWGVALPISRALADVSPKTKECVLLTNPLPTLRFSRHRHCSLENEQDHHKENCS
jgi:hypothetical protein